ncbi:DUF397 domain-containing protein [Sphaerisporangium sp. TRM90804]|uniref:DUF397 domain-containing protein n=1 Tax=Sphaerisporangium sp. TRM90804 TaxID=3031113 RepID=UPI0024498565|nr:DUF397 domain-containing protein [Sphaerisporangium sp. TRM90804]MDH2428398.1 DUF397 domain-containing protein [Sphaerisporangium sp. TRM90804]
MAHEFHGAHWRKSSFSGDEGDDCVEVASNLPDVRAVRDSKNPSGPVLVVAPGEWSVFLNGVRTGDLSV